eukprot:GDKI01008755.1.p1 GENE.GDKI01008755.1~~GDKI01008755.1.p1  ORF type:complete len:636 (+),score=188.48 GDKI01008755.1:96-2003(+)
MRVSRAVFAFAALFCCSGADATSPFAPGTIRMVHNEPNNVSQGGGLSQDGKVQAFTTREHVYVSVDYGASFSKIEETHTSVRPGWVSVDVSGDGGVMAVVNQEYVGWLKYDNTLHTYTQNVARFPAEGMRALWDVAMTSDGKTTVVCDGVIGLFSNNNNQDPNTWVNQDGACHHLDISAVSGTTVVSVKGDFGYTPRMSSAFTPHKKNTFHAVKNTQSVWNDVAVSGNGAHLVAGGGVACSEADCPVTLFVSKKGNDPNTPWRRVEELGERFWSGVAVSQDGRIMTAVCSDNLGRRHKNNDVQLVYYSTNHGDTWTKSEPFDHATSAGGGGRMFSAMSANGVHHMTGGWHGVAVSKVGESLSLGASVHVTTSVCDLTANVRGVHGPTATTNIGPTRLKGVTYQHDPRGFSVTASIYRVIEGLFEDSSAIAQDDAVVLPKSVAELRALTELRTYTIMVDKNGHHTMVSIGLAESLWGEGAHTHLEGEEAAMFMQEQVYKNEGMRPLLFMFDMIHRLVSPAGLLSVVMESMTDMANTNYQGTEYSRNYKFKTNDTPARYTDRALSKLYTPIPPSLNTHTFPIAYRADVDLHTPVTRVHATSTLSVDGSYLQPWELVLHAGDRRVVAMERCNTTRSRY